MWNKVFTIIKCILFLLIFVTFGYTVYGQIKLADERTQDMSFCRTIDTDWYRVWEDGSREAITLPSSVNIEKGKWDVVETVLYDKIDTGACISIKSSKQDVNVYIDGKLRESYSTKDTRLYGKTSIGRYIFIELDEYDAGKVLRIEMSSDSKYSGTVMPVYYGDKLAIWITIVKSNIASIIIPFILLVVSIITIIISAIYYCRVKKDVSVFYYAVTVMLISIWILAISSVRQLIFNNSTVIHDMSFVFSTLFLVPMSLYLNRLQNYRYKIAYGVYSLIALFYCLLSNALVILNVVDSSGISPYNFVVIGICMIIFVTTLYLDIKSKKISEYKDAAMGFLFLLIMGIVQMGMYFIPTLAFEGNALAIGIFVSLMVSIFHSVNEVEKVNDEKNFLKTKVTINESKIEALTYQALETLANTIDAKDNYTKGHSNRVANYAKEIAKRLGKADDEAIAIFFMGLLHDIGKIGVRDDILNKTNKLTEEEFLVIKNHPVIGYEILKNMTEIPNIEYGARWHHERYDGRGYPDGLQGEEIPEYARIICVADAYDAMTSTRSYREVMSQEKVRSEIENGKGKQFDPVIAQIMLDMMDEDVEYKMREEK